MLKVLFLHFCLTYINQAGAVLMPLAMFLLSLKSIRVLSIMNFILKLAYLYKVTEKKRLIYMHLLLYYVAYQDLKKEEN